MLYQQLVNEIMAEMVQKYEHDVMMSMMSSCQCVNMSCDIYLLEVNFAYIFLETDHCSKVCACINMLEKLGHNCQLHLSDC